jgi:hypothetical protein
LLRAGKIQSALARARDPLGIATRRISARLQRNQRAMRVGSSLLLACLLSLSLPSLVSARPEKIRAGHSYYSDDFVVNGLVRDIAAEKNYEEVYQSYTFYEAVYDEAGRVVVFKEYKRGEEIRAEEYRYGPDGNLLERSVRRLGKPAEITAVDPAGSEAQTQGVP